jgi:hypothetical protein
MNRNGITRQPGFSLTETLMAVGTLAIGMMFIAGTFMTGVYFATVSTERAIGVVAADEAFAKVCLYGLDPNQATTGTSTPYEQLTAIPVEEFLYPSTALISAGTTGGANPRPISTLETEQRQYSWAALCRRMGAGSPLVQCTVFVSRATGTSVNWAYWVRENGTTNLKLQTSELPRPVPVIIAWDNASLTVPEVSLRDAVPGDATDELTFVNDGATLVDDRTGQIYRVLERNPDQPDRIRLDRPWAGAVPGSTGWAWVVPSAASGGRSPVVGVYQKVIRFPEGAVGVNQTQTALRRGGG